MARAPVGTRCAARATKIESSVANIVYALVASWRATVTTEPPPWGWVVALTWCPLATPIRGCMECVSVCVCLMEVVCAHYL